MIISDILELTYYIYQVNQDFRDSWALRGREERFGARKYYLFLQGQTKKEGEPD